MAANGCFFLSGVWTIDAGEFPHAIDPNSVNSFSFRSGPFDGSRAVFQTANAHVWDFICEIAWACRYTEISASGIFRLSVRYGAASV
jgi:hypothetical protein